MEIQNDPPDIFTSEFKRLKARNPPPDLSSVIDLHSREISKELQCKPQVFHLQSSTISPIEGLMPCEQWKVFEFAEFPGFIVILNPFVNGYQRYWVARSLQDFPADKTNVTNLSALRDECSGLDLWQDFVKENGSSLKKQEPLRKLRWTTLGYHYNWTTKEYSEDRKAEFPLDVSCLTEYLAHCLGFDDFRAEAAIVNYYHLDSTLAGHTDHSEIEHSAPLFSISYGQPAVFLLGGKTKALKPIALMLHSGDVCIMSGKARLAYHAVPKILYPTSDYLHVQECFTLNSQDALSASSSAKSDSLTSEKDGEKMVQHDNGNARSISGTSEKSDAFIEKEGIFEFSTTCDTQMNNLHSEYEKNICQVNERIRQVVSILDFAPFLIYLNSSRINMNVRQVVPFGHGPIQSKCKIDVSETCTDLNSTGEINSGALSQGNTNVNVNVTNDKVKSDETCDSDVLQSNDRHSNSLDDLCCSSNSNTELQVKRMKPDVSLL